MNALHELFLSKSGLLSSRMIRRLSMFALLLIVLLSGIAGSISSYMAYLSQWASLESTFSGIKQIQVPELIDTVCARNTDLLAEQVREISAAPGIMHAAVSIGQIELASCGKITGDNLIGRKFPISCLSQGKVITGILAVTASTNHADAAAMQSFLQTGLACALLLSILAAALSLYFFHAFLRPLSAVTAFIRDLSPGQPEHALLFNKKTVADEIAELGSAVNSMGSRVHQHMLQLQKEAAAAGEPVLFFEQLLRTSSALMYWKDTTGKLLGCSGSFARLLGFDSPETSAEAAEARLPSVIPDLVKLESRALRQAYPWHGTIQAESATGPVSLHAELAPVLNRHGRQAGVAGFLQDITDQLSREARHKALQQKFESLLGMDCCGIAILSRGNQILQVNRKMCFLLESTEHELLQNKLLELLHPDDRDRAASEIDRLLSGGSQILLQELRFLRRDGSWADIFMETRLIASAEPLPECLAVMCWDISGLRHSQAQLHMFTAAVSQIQEIIIITDTKAAIQYVNPAFTRATGYDGPEVLGRTPALLRSGKQGEDFYQTLWTTILQGEIWRGRFINKKKNGELYNEEAAIYPVAGPGGETTNYLAVKRDITRDLKIEQQLRQVQKMEAIGSLAGGIAHDFNNILGVIYGYAEMSMDPSETLPEISSNLQQVISATNRAKDLIRQILTISRQTEKEALPMTITPIVKEVIKFIRASLPASIHIKQSLSAENDLLIADPIQIHQLLMNLCTNAGHAMNDANGVLEIALKNIRFSETDIQEYPFMRSGDYICLSVSDTGCGIPPENMERIFEPYFTTKEASQGTGLGLAVVHSIVRNCGGDIRVYSEMGKGSVFKVYLPLISRDAEKASEPAGEIPGGTEHILFVDDEVSLVKTSKIILERLGYTVTGITRPEEALALFKKTPELFDLLITDKTMPELTGFDLIHEIKSLRPEVPIILCTGVSAKTDTEKVREMGINALILKPFNKQELAGIIRDVLDAAQKQSR